MSRSEFRLIDQLFARLGAARADVAAGVGDDCALLRVPEGMELAVTTDTLNEGVHFPAASDPDAVGHKALAVNLSDLAAAGADPAWFTLALSLPDAASDWADGFARGLERLAAECGVALVGGDTVRGPLAVTIQAMGLVPAGQALHRRGARPGQGIYVTGTLGDAGAGLELALGRRSVSDGAVADALRARLDRPTPRLAAGQSLRGAAGAAIDLSDGLAADLGHVLAASGVGARVELERLPLSRELTAAVAEPEARLRLALEAGDDYELCFTLAEDNEAVLEAVAAACPVTRIGTVETEPGLCLAYQGEPWRGAAGGYDHFAGGTG
ncbi:MAG TPA: thiamine-phosphate kinase [Gammaproteobacteria bacterium]|nr:thiamine-phosphate kinase [Gammaproteobacteria bacterium]